MLEVRTIRGMKIVCTDNCRRVYGPNGERFYPICSFEENQHKIEYAYTKACNRYYDIRDEKIEGSEAQAYEEIERCEHMLEVFQRTMDGLVYGSWDDYNEIRETIAWYDAVH